VTTIQIWAIFNVYVVPATWRSVTVANRVTRGTKICYWFLANYTCGV